MKSGLSGEEAVEKLTMKQYDFLIDQDVNLDNLILTPEQRKVVQDIKRCPRRSGMTYNKVYPQNKQDFYNRLVEFVESQGATVLPRERINYRDLDFRLNDTHYRIVFSNPRT